MKTAWIWGFLLGASVSFAKTPKEILDQVSKTMGLGFDSGIAKVRMEMTKAQNPKPKIQAFHLKVMPQKALVKFVEPPALKGTAFRVVDDRQYLFLPASGASIKQVPKGNQAGSFFGSDFLFADLMPQKTNEKDTQLTQLPDLTLNNQKYTLIQVIPQVAGSPYGKVILYITANHQQIHQVDFYDTSKKLLKTMSVLRWKKVDQKEVPEQIEMKNIQKGSKTLLTLLELNTKQKLTDNDFSDKAMVQP